MGRNLFFIFLVFLCSFSIVSGENVCCSENECYSMDPPWNSEIRRIPNPRCLVNVTYRIYTRSNPNYPFNTTSTNITVRGSPYDPRKPTIFIFHGWMNSTSIESVRPLVMAILSCVDANVIVVDYSNVTASATYTQAASDIRVVAREVSILVRTLIRDGRVPPGNIHLIGLSLGAHTAAYVAKLVPGLGKLTGLDPSAPLFEHHSCTVRLCKGDAKFVEIIETNGNPTWGLGTHSENADLTFLLNGGFDQPGCGYKVDNSTWAVLKSGNFNIIADAPSAALCSHTRALLYYTEAIRNKNCTFWAVKAKILNVLISRVTKGFTTRFFINPFTCNLLTCVPIGLYSNQYLIRGTVLVATNPGAPFCVSCPLTDMAITIQQSLLKWVKKLFGWR